MGSTDIPQPVFEHLRIQSEIEKFTENGVIMPDSLMTILANYVISSDLFGAIFDNKISNTRAGGSDSSDDVHKRYAKENHIVELEVEEDEKEEKPVYSPIKRLWAKLNVSLALVPSYPNSHEDAQENDDYRLKTVINNWDKIIHCNEEHKRLYGASFLDDVGFWRAPVTAIAKNEVGNAPQPSASVFIRQYFDGSDELRTLNRYNPELIRFYGRAKKYVSASSKAMNRAGEYVKEAIVSAYMLGELTEATKSEEPSPGVSRLNEVLLGKIKMARAEIRGVIDDIHAHARVLVVGIKNAKEATGYSNEELNTALIDIKRHYDIQKQKAESSEDGAVETDADYDKKSQQLVNKVHELEIKTHRSNLIRIVESKSNQEYALKLQAYIEYGSSDKAQREKAVELLIGFYKKLTSADIMELLRDERLMPFERDFLKYVMIVNNSGWKIVDLDEYYLFPKDGKSNPGMIGYSGIQFIIEDENGRRSEVQIRSIVSDINANTPIGGAARGAYDKEKNGDNAGTPFMTADEFMRLRERIASKDLPEFE